MTTRIPAQVVRLSHLHPQVTARALGGTTCTVAASAPGSPNPGDLWVNSSNQYQLNQWSGSGWFAVPVNAGSLTGQNFTISAAGQFFYDSPPALTHWDFESGLEGWTGTNATAVQSGAQPHTGTYSALLTYASGTSWSAASPQQPVTAGVQVFASAWVQAPQNLGAVGLQLAWYNSGGTLLSTSSASTAALTAGSYSQFLFSATSPASAAFVSVIVRDNEASTTGYQLYADDVYLAGGLAASITPSGGTDPLGNAVGPGIWAYGPASGSAVGMAASGADAALILYPGGAVHSTLAAQLFSSTNNAGLANEAAELNLTSGKENSHDDAALQLFSAAADNSAAASAIIEFGGTVAVKVTKANASFTTNGVLTGTPAITQTDTTADTNANNGTQPCTMQWAVPAGDAKAGTVYEVETEFSGTAQTATLGFKPRLDGASAVTSGGDIIGGGFFTAGQGFAGSVKVRMVVTATGSGGTVNLFLDGGLGLNGNRSSGANCNSAYLSSQATSVAFDTTAAHTIGINSVFGSSVAGQVIVAYGSTFTRKGP